MFLLKYNHRMISTFFPYVPGIVATGIGFGAAYPDFKVENPAQTVTSFGGLAFMITCAGYIGLVFLKVRPEILPIDG
jgi:hypothetical protein